MYNSNEEESKNISVNFEKNNNLEEVSGVNEKVKPEKKRSKKIIIILVIIILIILLIISLIYILLNNNKNKNKDDEKYAILSDPIEFNYSSYIDYKDGLFKVYENNKYIIINEKKEIIEVNYPVSNNTDKYLSVVTGDNKSQILNIDGSLYMDNSGFSETEGFFSKKYLQLCTNDKCGISDNNLKLLVKQKYNYISTYDKYFIGGYPEKEEVDVYDSKLNLILENVILSQMPSFDMPIYDMNSNYIIIKNKDKYKVYYVKTKKLSKEYNYASTNDKYVAVSDGKKVVVKNNKGITVSKFNKNYDEYTLITKDILSIPNNTCVKKDEEDYNEYGILYDKNGKKLLKNDCTTIELKMNGQTSIKSDNKYYLYNSDEEINKINAGKDSYIHFNEYGNIEKNGDNNEIYDDSGNRILKKCKSVLQVNKTKFSCQTTNYMNYLVNKNDKFITKKPYAEISSMENGFIRLKDYDDNITIKDNHNNTILNVSKASNAYVTNDVLFISYKDKTYARKIKYVSKDEYKKYLRNKNKININENNDDGKKINYNDINIDDIINKYKLSEEKKLINDNKDIFKKFSYHVINNSNMTDDDKRHLLSMFKIILDYNKKFDIDVLLERIDELDVQHLNKRPDDMHTSAAGEYFDDKILIYVLNNDYEAVIEHELMHFISHAMLKTYENYGTYLCNNKFYNITDVNNMSFNMQKKCTHQQVFNGSSFLEESGAEYFSTYIYGDEYYDSYIEAVFAYNLIKYILNDDFKNIEFSENKPIALYKLLYEKAGYDTNKTNELLTTLDKLPKLSLNEFENKNEELYARFKAADVLIDLYNDVSKKDWKENDLVKLVIYTIISPALNNRYSFDRYLKSNTELNIKYYNDYFNLNYNSNDYIDGKIKEMLDSGDYYYSSMYYIVDNYNDNKPYSIDITVNAHSNEYILSIYYDENGKVIDTEKEIVEGPRG